MHKICVMFSFLWPYNFPFSVFSSIVTLSSWLFVILGCESALPLTVKGKGMGPQLVLNYDGMNLKDLFIGERFRQEVRKTKPVWTRYVIASMALM